MASEVEKIMDEFEAALVHVLQASHSQAGYRFTFARGWPGRERMLTRRALVAAA
jgi:hypothetical protein